MGTVGPFKGQAGPVGVGSRNGWPLRGCFQPWVVPYPLLALVVFSLQELALSERILISSGICAVTGFDPWD